MKESSSYFGKIILLLFLSIGAFYGAKALLPERLFSERAITNDNILVDSMLIEAIAADDNVNNDSLLVDNDISSVSDTLSVSVNLIYEQDSIGSPTITDDGYKNLSHFFATLYELEKTGKGKVRIAYFGDSMNDGDLIVQDVRAEFQGKYGGRGVGFVSITSLSAQSRYSVAHQYSKDWQNQSFINIKTPKKPFGIDGQVAMGSSGKNYWVNYKAMGMANCTQLYDATLFYGSGDNEDAYITVKVDKDSVVHLPLTPTKLLNTLKVTSKTPKSLRVDFYNIESLPIYGFNFDDGKGVHIDNFSLRGNSGLPLSILNVSLMNAFDRVLNYDLIILQYGANVLSYETKSYDWYERKMKIAVENLKACFPNADILILSTADKSLKIDGEMKTDPSVHLLIKAQKSYAHKTHSGFINLYELMGGENSMVKWVNDESGKKDYTHLTAKGSKKMAKLLYGKIDEAYTKYKLHEKVEEPQITGTETSSLPLDTLMAKHHRLNSSE